MPEPLQALRARVGAMPAPRLDAALAALVFGEALLEASLADAFWSARLAAAAPAALVAAGMLVRRREPLAAIALAGAGLALTGALADPVSSALSGIYFVALFYVYSMASRESGRRLLAGAALSEAMVILVSVTARGGDPLGTSVLAGTAIFAVVPLFAGRLLYSRLQLNRALEEKTRRLEAARADHAGEAAAMERSRIAGELHDVVAHALGAMTIQAAAARRLAGIDSARAGGAFEAIETTGRDALGELRTLLDALRGEEAPEPLHRPQPSLDSLSELADRAGAGGLGVEVEVHGERPAALATSVDITAYRVVQEALEQARRHGHAGSATVVVRYLDDRLEVEVTDDGTRAADRQLVGLRERARLYGGEVESGPRAGGHAVRARLPLEGVAA